MSHYAGELPEPLYRLHPAVGAVRTQPGAWIGPLYDKDAPAHWRALDEDVEWTLLTGWIGDVMRLVAARGRGRIYLDVSDRLGVEDLLATPGCFRERRGGFTCASSEAAVAAVLETNVALMVQTVGARAVLYAHDGWDGVFLCGHDEEILARFGAPLDLDAATTLARVDAEDDFDLVDGLAEERARYGIGLGDNVRIKTTPKMERLGYAGREGSVFGETRPSEGHVDDIVGVPETDYAVNVYFEDPEDDVWFAPHLVELVDHAPGTTMSLEGGPTFVRDEAGEWHEVARPSLLRRLFRRGR